MLIMFILLLVMLIVVVPFVRSVAYKKLGIESNKSAYARINYYWRTILPSWVLTFFLLAIFYFNKLNFSALGFRSVNLHWFYAQSLWMKILIAVIVLAYIVYVYLYPMVFWRFDEKALETVKRILVHAKKIIPQTKGEKWWWAINCFTAAADELLYRGFIFFFVMFLFPAINIWLVILISMIVESLRFWPRYVIMLNVLFAGLFFALMYVTFHSIYIVMLLHIAQYSKAIVMPFHLIDKEEDNG